ncbi:LppU/SCO3897 family protein [Saccharothrix syringae]|uniref:Uncharacterized protein n=1 Tax=Saccharothrix syringae TaxID=103733 RepID=A0A5Q0GSK8_SACSY|nr:hypothetical protein [Saccharothrix syringae]QFZ16464.1 hypothetical protein EKG83_02400 [Saccharothrix syringae]
MTTPPNPPPGPPHQPDWNQPPQGSPAPQPGHQPPGYPQPGQTGFAAPDQAGSPQPGYAQPGFPHSGYPQAGPGDQAHAPHPPGAAQFPGQQFPGQQFPGQAPGQQFPGQQFPGQPFQGAPYPPQFPGQQLPPQRTSRGPKVLIAVVVLGIVGVVVAGLFANATGPGGADEGDCMKINSAGVTDADVEQIDCASPEAAFKVASRLGSSTDSCPDGDYVEFYERGGRRSDGYKLCLVLNAAEGDCFKQEGGIVAGKTTKVACGTPGAFKVVRVIDGRADENECESGDSAVVYSRPAGTICLTGA